MSFIYNFDYMNINILQPHINLITKALPSLSEKQCASPNRIFKNPFLIGRFLNRDAVVHVAIGSFTNLT